MTGRLVVEPNDGREETQNKFVVQESLLKGLLCDKFYEWRIVKDLGRDK